MTQIRETPCAHCQHPVAVEAVQDFAGRLAAPDPAVRRVERCTNPECITNDEDAAGRLGAPRP